LIRGEDFFYLGLGVDRGCSHSLFYMVWDYNDEKPVFCGLCYLTTFFQDEFPKKIHAYKVLAENGNPETDPRFWSHLEAQCGLIPPRTGQDLREYRRARKGVYGVPSKRQFPVTHSLWTMMGYQPKIARPLLRALWGLEETDIAREFHYTIYNTHATIGKGVRLALRNLRS
jgi:hypothetical protein